MIKAIWIYPPLAIARVGSSEVPLEGFFWGPNDDRPRGTGKTTIVPAETLKFEEDGTLSSYIPDVVQFKDGDTFRPVCPFYELHGEWEVDNVIEKGPLTPELLTQFGLSLKDIKWSVQVANLKAFHLTNEYECRIDASMEINGEDTEPKTLNGISPVDAVNPLIPHGQSIPLGIVRLTKPSDTFPELRLRFLPAKGKLYGPPDLNKTWVGVQVPEEQLFLNPNSKWVGWRHKENDQWNPNLDDVRTAPGDLYAADRNGSSYGVVDDVCDGLITCSIAGTEATTAYARITVGPPDYAPDRRHLISIADALKDYVDRDEVHKEDYVKDRVTEKEVQDLMERIYETMSLINIDVFNNRVAIQENPATAFSRGIPFNPSNLDEYYAFKLSPPVEGQTHPLTIRGRQFHRRFVSIEVFRDMLRERPEIIYEWVRSPADGNPFFNKQMPPVMRDSSGGPLHLTRRQYDLLIEWAKSLRKIVEEHS